MTYRVGEAVLLSVPSAITTGMVLTITAPDGTTSTPAATYSAGVWSASVTPAQAGDYVYVFAAPGFVYEDQFHVIASTLRIVGLAEVKEHGNITSTNSDKELLDFIGTAQQMIEDEVGAVVPRTVTSETVRVMPGASESVFLRWAPVLSITSVVENGLTLAAGNYRLWPRTGQLDRLHGWGWRDNLSDLLVTYQPGRSPIPEAIRWGAKDLTIHLWRSSQALRAGRGRGGVAGTDDTPASAAAFGLPNRVRDALKPYRLPDVDVF